MVFGKYIFVWKAIKYLQKQGGEIINTPSFIIGLEDKSTKEVFPHPISHFLFKNYHRNSGSLNTELTVAQIIVPFLNFVLEKVIREMTEYAELRGLEDFRLIVEHKKLIRRLIILSNFQ